MEQQLPNYPRVQAVIKGISSQVCTGLNTLACTRCCGCVFLNHYTIAWRPPALAFKHLYTI